MGNVQGVGADNVRDHRRMTDLRRTLIVIEPANVDAANQAVAEATGNPADALTFTVPLLDDKDQIIGYVASWDFEGTGVDFETVRKVVETSVGAPKDAGKTKRTTASGDLAGSKLLVYDAKRVVADQVFTNLGAKTKAAVAEEIQPL